MKINILTLFPELFDIYLSQTILKRAIDKNLIEYDIVNIRDYATNKHKQVDDVPFGGGAGMLLKPEPYFSYFKKFKKRPYTIFLSPQGKKLDQKKVIEISNLENLCIISGRYEGLDQRVIDKFVDEEISIGDYVLSSGDLPALVLIDSITRIKEGVIKKDSYESDSFYNGLLGFSQYTRPQEIDGMKVPDVLISGNHKKIEEFRELDSIYKSIKNRPDLINEKLKEKEFEDKYSKILKEMLKK